jgi:hypothetical protein
MTPWMKPVQIPSFMSMVIEFKEMKRKWYFSEIFHRQFSFNTHVRRGAWGRGQRIPSFQYTQYSMIKITIEVMSCEYCTRNQAIIYISVYVCTCKCYIALSRGSSLRAHVNYCKWWYLNPCKRKWEPGNEAKCYTGIYVNMYMNKLVFKIKTLKFRKITYRILGTKNDGKMC